MELHPPVPLQQVARLINAELIGDASFPVTGINEIHMVRPGDVTFVDHPKYYKKAFTSAASVIIINHRSTPPAGKHLLVCPDPFEAYNTLVNHYCPELLFQPSPSQSMVDATAQIGEGTLIMPGTFIGPQVRIGKNCRIHSNVSIYARCVIGDHAVIHSGTVIGADAFYFKKYPDGSYRKMQSCGRVVIGSHVEIGACCTIDRGVSADTIISDGCKLDNHVHIGHDTYIGPNCLFAAHVAVAGVTRIEEGVTLWGQVGVNKDLVIGPRAVVYAQSGVSGSLKGGKTYFGSPAIPAEEKLHELRWLRRQVQQNSVKKNK
ncbi:MAG: UDP-3-O-(3-hydroxymyristoyl)glucosamine N-acyltransferase [Chitinophagales bacterium]|nr:UDP-3-O-(3-hydroxymyristoyl)glucosamine N-acyltransferase [Chitinophagales bacterium]MDW8428831.1 UDP-3-O-(3-hydroxymyristoyl)glucosamine N-acyltransferase [Chitinophagales bacterium]